MENLKNNQNQNINNEISLRKYLNIIIAEKRLIIYLTLIFAIIGASYSLLKKPVWRGEFMMVTEENNASKNSLLNNMNLLNNPLNQINNSASNKTRLEILKSSSVLEPVYKFVKNNDPKLNLSYKKWINKKISIKYETGTDILVVAYKDHNKEKILSTLTKIKDEFQEYSLSNRKRNLNQSINYLTKQKKVFSEKYQKSLAELNKFTLENGLGNIDGFFADEKNISQSSNDIPINDNQTNFKAENKNPNKGTQRYEGYAIQFANLESKEALYNQLSSLLKPNSETIINLSSEIQNLKEALKRPNEILIKYRDLETTAKRNQSLFYRIIDELELTKLEQVRQLKPWIVIAPPNIDELRESPKRKVIVINYFLVGLLFSSILAIVKHNRRGIVFEKEDFERYLDIKFDGYIGEDVNLNNLFMKKFKANLNKEEYLAILKLEDSESDNSKYFKKDSKIKFISLKKLEELENFRSVILIAYSGKIKFKTLDKIKEYLKIYKNNIKGSFLKNI